MMKKILIALSLVFILVFALVSCDTEKNSGECLHESIDVKTENRIEATCTDDGSYDEVEYCTDCDTEISRVKKTLPSSHVIVDGTSKEPTCLEDGYTADKHCSKCGAVTVKSEPIPATGHILTGGEYHAPTCEEPGWQTEMHCTACDFVSPADDYIPPVGHSHGSAVIENEVSADCENDGSYDEVVYCIECKGEVSRVTKTVPSEGHTPIKLQGYAATETKDGLTDGEACEKCKTVLKEQTVIPAAIVGTDIKTDKLTVNGASLTLTVPYETSQFNFATDIRTNVTTTFTVSEYSDGHSPIDSKTVTLSEGENTYYVTVTASDGTKKTYTATIRRENAPIGGITLGDITIPLYSGEPKAIINGNVPRFDPAEITEEGFYEYSELDSLGRAGVAFGCIGPETLPTTPREGIGSITPSGWKYNGSSNNHSYSCIPGGQTVYNRTHLFAHMLVENDVDKRNFVTGTHSMNQTYMQPFENQICDYVKETGNHVMYRVTPVFEGDNLVCTGLLLEGYSVEDKGASISFCVFVYNVQEGVEINYLTGENKAVGATDPGPTPDPDPTPDPEDPGDFEVGKAYYIMGTYSSGVRYFNGTVSSGIQTTQDKSSATVVYLESAGVTNGYYIYTISSKGEKNYLVMTGNKTTTVALKTTKDNYWIYKESVGAFVSSYNSGNNLGNRCIALDPSRTDMRCYYEGETGATKQYKPVQLVAAE